LILRRLLEARLGGARRLAAEVLDGIDDRGKLLALELAAEQQRLTRLAVLALLALIVSTLAIVWCAATVVALAWDTEWRNFTLLAMLAFWILFAAGLGLKLRSLLKQGGDAFRLSREVATEDFNRLRELLR
jgi:uncharacterized membrane protein YqjE